MTLPAWPEIDHSQFGPVDAKVPVGRMQRLTGSMLSRNWQTIPHVTHHDDADVTALEARRRALSSAGRRPPGLLSYVVKAVSATLSALPQFNVSLDGTAQFVTRKHYYHVGVAIDTPGGLLVGVVRDCDAKSVPEIGADIERLATLARSKGLPMSEMMGGCMTVSSLGHIGGTAFTPIVNAPEVAILGLGRTRAAPAPGPDGGVEWRTLLPLSLSYDHRAINGADAARFCRTVASSLDGLSADPSLA